MQLLLMALFFLCNNLTKLAHFYGVKYNSGLIFMESNIIKQKVLQISNMIVWLRNIKKNAERFALTVHITYFNNNPLLQ